MLAVVTVGGVAALVVSTREAARSFAGEPPAPEVWRRYVLDLLVHGLARGRTTGAGASPSDGQGDLAPPP